MSKKPVRDQPERDRAVRSRGENLWIEAGAGTGKTTLLIDRIFSLLVDSPEPARLRDIAAITFTEKAAGELKIKVRERIEKRLREALPDRERDLLREALIDLEIAPIQTLHGFALSLLKERPVEARIDPNAAPDNDAVQRLLADFYNEWFDEQVLRSPPDPALKWYLQQRELYERQGNWDWLWRLAQRICADKDILLDAPAASRLTLAEVCANVQQSARELLEHARDNCDDTSDKAFVNSCEVAEAMLALPPLDDRDAFFAALSDLPGATLRAGGKKAWRDDALAENKEKRKALRQSIDWLAALRDAEWVWRLFALAQSFARAFEEKKRERGLLDYQDLLVRAATLLRENKDVRAYFQQRFRHVLIDEFQDTDPLQVEIALFLGENGATADKVEAVKLQAGKLVVVGDPKQSIYRFRRADIEVYESTKRLLLANGEPQKIWVNFRCARPIIDAVNAVFAPLMRHDPARPANPNYVPLEAGRDHAPEPAGVYLLQGDRALASDDRHAQIEMAAVARWIRRAVDEQWPTEDKDTRQFRPLRWADVAVLFRRGSYVELLENALRAEGVPYRVEGGKTYFRRPEIEALVHGLRALENPDDSLALSQWLGSDLVGFSDEALLVHVLSRPDRQLSYFGLKDGDDDMSALLAEMRGLHEARNNRGCLSTARGLLDLVGALPTARTFPHGEVAVANLHKVLEAARGADAAGLTFGDFAREWAQAYAEEREEADYAITEASDDLVRILTIHKAKGLDWPVVVVPELGAGFRGSGGDVQVRYRRSERNLSVRLVDGVETEDYRPMDEDEEALVMAERQRLLYVAMTRARDYLVLPLLAKPQTTKSGKPSERENFLRFFIEAGLLDENLNVLDTSHVRVEQIAVDQLPITDTPRWDLPRRVQNEPANEATEKIIDEAMRERERIRATVDRADLPLPLVFKSPSERDQSLIPTESRPDGRLLGTAFHALMERIDVDDAATWDDAAAHVALLFELKAEYGALVRRWLDNLSHMKAFAEVRGRPHWREVPFTWTDPHGAAFHGQLDLLAETPGGLLILDYKTDAVTRDNVKRHVEYYRRQGEIYRAAVRALRPDAKSVRMVFCFVDERLEQHV